MWVGRFTSYLAEGPLGRDLSRTKELLDLLPFGNSRRAFLSRARLGPLRHLIQAYAVLNSRSFNSDREFSQLTGYLDHWVVSELCDGEGDRFIKRFGLRVGDVSEPVGIDK